MDKKGGTLLNINYLSYYYRRLLYKS